MQRNSSLPFLLGIASAATVLIQMMLMQYQFDLSALGRYRFATAWIPILFLFIAIMLVKKSRESPEFSFLVAFKAGLKTVLASVIFATLFISVWITIDPEVFQAYINDTLLFIQQNQEDMQKDIAASDFEQLVAKTKTTSQKVWMFDYFQKKFFWEILVCALVSAFHRV